jgi:hypothetical protein
MQPRVFVSALAVAPFTTVITVAGCPFQIPVGAGTKPQPCVTVKWGVPSTRVMVMGQPAAVVASPGPGPAVCQSPEQIPNGPPIVSTFQTRVIAT